MICNTCLEDKPIEAYYKDARNTYKGVRGKCKVCFVEKRVFDAASLQRIKTWATANKERNQQTTKARNAKRRASKVAATPIWANLAKLKQIYAACPEGYHVDHVIPLQGKFVTGLHVENNLQYLPAKENISKGNRALSDAQLQAMTT